MSMSLIAFLRRHIEVAAIAFNVAKSI